ncbi:elongator complex protein 2 [Nematocida displodere]|uniref:Elongator complex protein 2 n=1 Tax=Nematocida displodere TaxID=1805483 RepID=A0A177EHM7_9MICR|nr:elongator complex protein 2 [Nematocida displodere]
MNFLKEEENLKSEERVEQACAKSGELKNIHNCEVATFSLGGCTLNTPNASALYEDRLYYICGRVVISAGTVYTPTLTTNITCLDVSGGVVAVGSVEGAVSLVEVKNRKERLIQGQGSVLCLRYVGGVLVFATKECLYLYRGSECLFKIQMKHVVVDCALIVRDSDVHVVLGTYDGRVVVYALSKEKTSSTESISHKSEIRTVAAALSGETIEICVGLALGKVGIFAYQTAKATLKKVDMLTVHRSSCKTARWTDSTCTQVLTSSEDGTVTLWSNHGQWECTKRMGATGGPQAVNALMATNGTVYIQSLSGGFSKIMGGGAAFLPSEHFRAADESQTLLSNGHTKKIASIDAIEVETPNGAVSLLLTASEDRTVRIWQLGRETSHASEHGLVVEVSRPLISGYPMASAIFLDPMTICTAADENLLRVLKGTGLYRRVLGLKEKEGTPFTAATQELSLTNLPQKQEQEEEEIIYAQALTETGLQSHPFYESHKAYGYPFEMKDVKCLRNRFILSCCKSSQKAHSSLFVSDMEYEIVQRLEVHTLNITKILVSASASFVLTVGRDRRLALFRVEEEGGSTAQPLTLLDTRIDHKREILAAAFSKNGTEIYTSGKDRKLLRYSIVGGSLDLQETASVPDPVTALLDTPLGLLKGTESGALLTPTQSYKLYNTPVVHLVQQTGLLETGIIAASHDGIFTVIGNI